jgi:hypothetical protein
LNVEELDPLHNKSIGSVIWLAEKRREDWECREGAAHRTAAESSGDGGGFVEFRRAIPSVWGDLSRGKKGRGGEK